MRALGLPNTKHFHEITKIEDAMACTCRIVEFFALRAYVYMRSGGAIEAGGKA
jgi:hypothetical protein